MDISYVDYEKEGISVSEKLQPPSWQLRGTLYRFKTKELAELYYNTLKQIGIDPDVKNFISHAGWQQLHTGAKAGRSELDFSLYTIVRGKDIATVNEAFEAVRATAKDIKKHDKKN